MAFDQTTRNRLARFVSDTRSLLSEEFTRQLQNDYGLDPNSGDVTDLARLEHLDDARRETARLLRDTMEHYLASADTATPAKAKKARQDVLDRIVREQAFTILNRLCALRMAEARGLLIESIAKGYQSKGFQLYQRLAGIALGETGACYRQFIFSVFDEFAVDLPVLFDRFSPQGRLFPREAALLNVLQEINHPDIDPLWAEDETIGWIYQYFNSVEERRQMRADSQAPRNSRELAVRNQFFTPRYVVEFLTDNTLGRIWYEMTKGQSSLKESCRYLVRRPNEIFLAEGEAVPEQDDTGEELSQEELLKQPVYILHRPLKDPRDIKMLDPACGSMHFGLYAFDLFERIYEEAWEIEAQRGADGFVRTEGLKSLHEFYADKDAFLCDVPRLIIERNIHGIDIDPRAVQIAGLSLWLRAQRSWQVQNVKALDRPQIQRSNIVCAEPMPGEADMLEEFTEQLQPKVLGQLVKIIFEKMKLAGEAGSLLKIEEEIKDAVSTAHKAFRKHLLDQQKDSGYLPGMAPKREATMFDFAGLPEEDDFWNSVEVRIIDALRDYAEKSENGSYQRRLFANDAAQGFSFIDLCRKRYDSVVMNPPFGETVPAARRYIADSFSASKDDLYASFVSRGVKMLSHGFLGVISNRTGFFLTGMKHWRESTLLATPSLSLLADLGDGVLDEALVEAAAYTLHESSAPCTFFRLLDQADKETPLREGITQAAVGQISRSMFVNHVTSFHVFPESRISYWAPPSVREIYRTQRGANGSGLDVKFGLSTKDDWRFLRLCWEISTNKIVSDQEAATPEMPWMWIAKGGEYSLYFGDIHLVSNWANRGYEIAARVIQRYPYLNGDANWVLHTEVPYGRPGITYTKRTTSGFSPRVLPAGCLISDLGCTVFADDDSKLSKVLATYSSRSFGYLLEFSVASGDSVHSGSAARHYEIGTVASVPIPPITDLSTKAGNDAMNIWRRKAVIDCRIETSRYFLLPCQQQSSLFETAVANRAQDVESFVEILAEVSDAEAAVKDLYGFDSAAFAACDEEFGPDVTNYSRELSNADRELVPTLWNLSMSELVAETSSSLGYARFISKMTFVADRRLELICHRLRAHPQAVADLLQDLHPTGDETRSVAQALLSYALGCIMGRWNIRFAMGNRKSPDLLDPFAPLPVCPPGMLQSAMGLPAEPKDVPTDYPLHITWFGILVDDESHPEDIVTRVRETIEIIWKSCAEAIEQEACVILGVNTLRGYFQRPSNFFDDHLKRYSKSRRQAPIYLPLSTPSGSYTLWLYYHRLTDQTLYTCVNDFVDPKLKQVSDDASGLRSKSNRSSAEEKELERLSDLELELKDFRDELLRIARFWEPNLNDGVQITAAPLWNLFQHRQWKARLKETWEKLEAGDYDWAHLALSIWPDRVVRASHKDRSYAIAHDIEDPLWHEVEVEKVGRGGRVTTTTEWQPRDLSSADLQRIITEVKAR